jgi:hypothetical protein
MKPFATLCLAVALGAISGAAGSARVGKEQASSQQEPKGRIFGKITPKVGVGYDVVLIKRGSDIPVAFASVDTLHGVWKFALEDIPPGIYELEVHHGPNPGPNCGIGSWSNSVSVRPGETVRVTVKLSVDHNARCE